MDVDISGRSVRSYHFYSLKKGTVIYIVTAIMYLIHVVDLEILRNP